MIMTQKDEIIAMVERFMLASMAGERTVTDELMSPQIEVTFTGGRRFAKPEDVKPFNAARYSWVKKAIERYDVAFAGDEVVVYSIGTLYGAWPDGEAFEGNRYVDRFVIRDGKIVKMDVWNDSAERLMVRAGLAEM
jgi:ketosteroid isomerase-like protein